MVRRARRWRNVGAALVLVVAVAIAIGAAVIRSGFDPGPWRPAPTVDAEAIDMVDHLEARGVAVQSFRAANADRTLYEFRATNGARWECTYDDYFVSAYVNCRKS